MVSLDIISDPICPWCYIGKRKFDMAVEERGYQPFDIRWRIFQLNPTMPAEGMDRQSYLDWKFGGREASDRIYGEIARVAGEAGLNLRFDLMKRTPNTFEAHRLILWSQTTGNQTAVVNQLFVRYFEKGEDIGDRDLLLDVAESAGLDRDVVLRLFTSDADCDLLKTEEAKAREMGVNGVPTFIVGGKYVLTGAQEKETWTRVLDELAEVSMSAEASAGASS